VDLHAALEEGWRCLSALSAGRVEAEILLAQSLSAPRSFLYANPELELPDARTAEYRALLRRRARGEPMAYITGHREFWSLRLQITPDVLIPRHETELLVESALEFLPAGECARVADLGTGSGAVALAIASERPHSEIHGTDTEPAAVDLARRNARELGLERVHFHTGSWFSPLSGPFGLVVSNPPYIGHDDPHLREGDCRFEPRQALTDNADGLAALREIIMQAPDWLASGGWLMLEHGRDQGAAVRELMAAQGFEQVATRRDLAGHERVTLGRAGPHGTM
jgi:release factor glutamine methyltransferase